MNEILKYLAIAEGTSIHRITSEPDITAPNGISRHNHPKAEIFKYIDEVAELCDIQLDSTIWTEKDMEIISAEMNPEVTKELASKFYEEYLKNAHLYLFPEEAKVAMYSMYTNSSYGAWWSVQESISQMKASQSIIFNQPISSSDGAFGNKTEDEPNIEE